GIRDRNVTGVQTCALPISLMRMSEVMKEELPDANIAILSGPTLAKEVLAGCPTAASVACENMEIAKYVQEKLTVPSKFRLYTNEIGRASCRERVQNQHIRI